MSCSRLSVLLFLALSLLMGSGCVTNPERYKKIHSDAGKYDVRMLAKSDLSRAAELGQREVLKSLRMMMAQLYAANPQQLERAQYPTIEANVKRIFGQRIRWNFPEFGRARGNNLLHLAFDESYRGDRVLLFTAALVSMTMRSYNGTTELYMLDQLDPQKIYNTARNFEIALRMVEQVKLEGRAPLLLQNGQQVSNQISRAAANQDLIAILIADQTNRQLTGVVHSLASMVLLPI